MIQNITNSLKANISQKSTNPFLSTLIIVWLIKEWKFIYSIFNFDKDCTLNDKITIIESYFTNYSVITSLWDCIWVSLVVLLITYSLLSVSRLIVNFYDKIVNPQVYKLTDKSSIVLKSDYIKAIQENNRLEKRVEEERESKIRIQNDYETLEKRLAAVITSKDKFNVDVNPSQPLRVYSEKNELIYNKLKKDGSIENFYAVSSNILNGKKMKRTEENVYYAELGLISGKYVADSLYDYILTSDGKSIYDRILLDKLSS